MIQKFEFHNTEIEGLVLVVPFNADDNRGLFTKDYSKEIFEQNGIKHELAEVFYTTSYKGVIRAIHFQREKQQPKLVRCIYGSIYDVLARSRHHPIGYSPCNAPGRCVMRSHRCQGSDFARTPDR